MTGCRPPNQNTLSILTFRRLDSLNPLSTFKSRPTDTNTCREGLTKVDAVRDILVVAISLFKDTPFTF